MFGLLGLPCSFAEISIKKAHGRANPAQSMSLVIGRYYDPFKPEGNSVQFI
jgi:hypothetical protein